MRTDLAVEFCGVHLVNPFVLASSPCTDTADIVARGFDAGWAGAVLKTTATEEEEVSIAYPIMSSLNRDGRIQTFAQTVKSILHLMSNGSQAIIIEMMKWTGCGSK